MLLQTMENSIRPAEGQHTLTPETIMLIEDAIWSPGNQSGTIVIDIDSWFLREIPNGTVGEKLMIGFAAGKHVDAICTAEGHSRFLAVVFVVYWLYLAVHAVDLDMARLLTPVRYGGTPNPKIPQLTQDEALSSPMHGENDDNPDVGNHSMDLDKMQHATKILLKKCLPDGPDPTPEKGTREDSRQKPRAHSRAQRQYGQCLG